MKKTALALTLVITAILSSAACSASAPLIAAGKPSAETEKPFQTAQDEGSISPETSGPSETVPESASFDDIDIAGATIDYILNGQDALPEAGRLHWSEIFLNLADIEAVYADYLKNGGNEGDIEGFAVYLTDNAPVPDNWRELFEADLLARYEAVPSRYEPLGDDIYQVYVKIDGREVPYVAVNARTGYYHG